MNERTNESINQSINQSTKGSINERFNQPMNERNIKTTIQTSQLNSFLDFEVAYFTSFHTISKCFTNFVGDCRRFFVFIFFHFYNNSKTYLDASITEKKMNQKRVLSGSLRSYTLKEMLQSHKAGSRYSDSFSRVTCLFLRKSSVVSTRCRMEFS